MSENVKSNTVGTKNEIIKNAAAITVINDGQFRYPVMTESLKSWVDSHGAITSANYDQFCSDVECVGEIEAGTPGNTGMIELCRELIDAGSEGKTL